MTHPLPLEAGGALHNMSAPPRSTFTLSPFAPQSSKADPASTSTAWGLCWALRVDLSCLIVQKFPGSLPVDIARGSETSNPYLCGAVALARGLRGEDVTPWDLEDQTDDRLADELLGWASEARAGEGLPRLMMVSPATNEERPLEMDPMRVLAVLTHVCGRTCDLGASPVISEGLSRCLGLDFWAPEGAVHA